MAQSADDTIIYGTSGAIIDASGNTWSINSGGQVTVNGVIDATTNNTIALAYVSGLVWQENNQGLWWSKTSATAAWEPPAGITTNPAEVVQVSEDGTVIAATSDVEAVSITDTNDNTWRIANGQVVANGVIDQTTANVIEIAYENGQVWQENSQGLWWSKSTPADAWGPPSGTSVNPVTGTFYIGNAAGDQAVINMGELTASTGAAAAPLSTSQIITTGVEAAGTTILVSTSSAMLVIDGDSSITQGATLDPLGAYRAPRPIYAPVQNNGGMVVDASTVDIGALGGNGSIHASDGSTLNIQSSSAGNTIQLVASHLYIGGQAGGPGTFGVPGGLSFLAPITMDAASAITLNATQATSEVVNSLGGSGNEVILYDGTAKVADLDINGPANIYAVDDAQNDRVTLTATDNGSSLPITATPPAYPGVSVTDTTTDQPVSPSVQSYSGPVTGLQNQYIATGTTDGLNVTTTTPNWFIATGSGYDAINIAQGGGNNVLDGGAGSNFLTGGSGDDTFFVDDRLATSAIWSSVTGFHTGDNVTVWGVTPQDFTLTWLDGQGAAGNTGLTLSATSANRPDANVTLAGYTSADLNNGRLTVSFGTTPNEPGLAGSSYMQITAT